MALKHEGLKEELMNYMNELVKKKNVGIKWVER